MTRLLFWFLFGMLMTLSLAPVAAGAKSTPVNPDFDNAFGISAKRFGEGPGPYTYVNTIADYPNRAQTETIKVAETACSAPANMLWPGEHATITIQVVNKTDQPITAQGKVEVINYALSTSPTDMFYVGIHKLGVVGATPIAVHLAAKGYQDFTFTPPIPEKFGGYALIVDIPGQERLFAATLIRTQRNATLGPRYRLCMDIDNVAALQRLGSTTNRLYGTFAAPEDADYAQRYADYGRYLKKFQDAGLPVTIEFGAIGGAKQPLPPEMRHHLQWDKDGKPIFVGGYPGDMAWLPKYDPAFKAWVKRLCLDYGWPKGPISAMKLWNEPWEGDSCAGWGADMLRYREIYTSLCEGVEEARKEAGVFVMLGGCDSSSNTFDKLFPDGKDTFLQRLDFMSIHYQGMNPASTVKQFVNRKNDRYGPVQVWDTESWCANSDDRVAATLPTMYAAGYQHAVGIHSGCVVSPACDVEVRTPTGSERRHIAQAWSVGSAVGALQHFVGNREFDRILFDGLPFVYVFNGIPDAQAHPNPEDSTLVVVGDFRQTLGATLFRTVRSLDDVVANRALFEKLVRLPVGSAERAEAELTWNKHVIYTHATLTILNKHKRFSLYDYYGNPVPALNGKIVVPIDDHGYYLRANGRPGSFAAMVTAVQEARIDGLQPVEIIAHDLTSPLDSAPVMRLDLHNLLNRPVHGTLAVRLADFTLQYPTQVALAANAHVAITVRITGGAANATNAYPLNVSVDAGRDGLALWTEVLHVNVIAHRTITVDGDLQDWDGVLPQTIIGDGVNAHTLTEIAWKPYTTFGNDAKKGLATGYLAYDDRYFYFAAKIADDTPDAGTYRFATRNDDEFFYPKTVYTPQGQAWTWPDGVRQYSYAKLPVLPAGNAPNFDNVQLAFNVLSEEEKPWYTAPKGTLPGFVSTWCTDYEYALNQVAEAYGGGTEVWRMRAPGLPNKHFYPRQPKSPLEGPVTDGKLAMQRSANLRVVECALPWTEIPSVKKAFDAGQTIKFSFRVNDNGNGACLELARYRSVSTWNTNAFKVDWTEHWDNQVEFGFGK